MLCNYYYYFKSFAHSAELVPGKDDDLPPNGTEIVASAAVESKLSAISELLGQTAEQAERAREKAQRKADNMSTFGWQAFTGIVFGPVSGF